MSIYPYDPLCPPHGKYTSDDVARRRQLFTALLTVPDLVVAVGDAISTEKPNPGRVLTAIASSLGFCYTVQARCNPAASKDELLTWFVAALPEGTAGAMFDRYFQTDTTEPS